MLPTTHLKNYRLAETTTARARARENYTYRTLIEGTHVVSHDRFTPLGGKKIKRYVENPSRRRILEYI